MSSKYSSSQSPHFTDEGKEPGSHGKGTRGSDLKPGCSQIPAMPDSSVVFRTIIGGFVPQSCQGEGTSSKTTSHTHTHAHTHYTLPGTHHTHTTHTTCTHYTFPCTHHIHTTYTTRTHSTHTLHMHMHTHTTHHTHTHTIVQDKAHAGLSVAVACP